ncbi:MAG TPA: hypothetical protein VI819_05120 [Patescibacteria group bacterium]|nr:hypothetical protein [Patescibacteria group bacterium]
MSKIFYDEFIDLGDFHMHLKSMVQDDNEKEDLWHLVDEFIHLRMIEIILDNLHEDLHEEFLRMFGERPYDESLVTYLDQNMAIKFPILVENEMEYLQNELYEHFGIQKPVKLPVKKKKKKTSKTTSKA